MLPLLLCRRNELQEAFGNEEKLAQLQQAYSASDVQAALMKFIEDGRAKLGPPLIKVCFNIRSMVGLIEL